MKTGKMLYPFTVIAIALMLTACGGSGGGSDDPEPPLETACVLGESNIGDCTL